MPDSVTGTELNDARKAALAEAMDQWIMGNRKPLRLASPDIAFVLENSFLKICKVVKATSAQNNSMVQEVVGQIEENYVNPNNPEKVTLNDAPLNEIYDRANFLIIIGFLIRTTILDSEKHFIKGDCNARCLVGVFQFFWDYGFFKNGLHGKKITKRKALNFLNKLFLSNIGDDFYRKKDPLFVKFAFELIPKLKTIEKEIRKTAPHRVPRPEIYAKYQ